MVGSTKGFVNEIIVVSKRVIDAEYCKNKKPGYIVGFMKLDKYLTWRYNECFVQKNIYEATEIEEHKNAHMISKDGNLQIIGIE